jgi:TetR/AcrR family transcriptional regulator of autoinduction and epiphytic fitness
MSGCEFVDPRVERSRRVILEATLDELGEVGYGALAIESVARRAGVGKATVYRHWPGKLALVADAVVQLKPAHDLDDSGPLRDRIVALLRSLTHVVTETRWARCMPALIEAASRDECVRAFHHAYTSERRARMVGLIDEGKATGLLEVDLDSVLVAELLAGPIFYRRLMTDAPFPADRVEELVDRVLPELASRGAPRAAG